MTDLSIYDTDGKPICEGIPLIGMPSLVTKPSIPPGTKDAMDRAYLNQCSSYEFHIRPGEEMKDKCRAKLDTIYSITSALCLFLLFTGMCLGLTGVWIDGFSNSDLCYKLHETNWILFMSSLAGALISGFGSGSGKEKK